METQESGELPLCGYLKVLNFDTFLKNFKRRYVKVRKIIGTKFGPSLLIPFEMCTCYWVFHVAVYCPLLGNI